MPLVIFTIGYRVYCRGRAAVPRGVAQEPIPNGPESSSQCQIGPERKPAAVAVKTVWEPTTTIIIFKARCFGIELGSSIKRTRKAIEQKHTGENAEGVDKNRTRRSAFTEPESAADLRGAD